jgi:hypothetical protein
MKEPSTEDRQLSVTAATAPLTEQQQAYASAQLLARARPPE